MGNKLKRLKKGLKFHSKVQNIWSKKAEGKKNIEKSCTKPSGRRGRMDIHVEVNEENNLVACVEIKDSNWDRMTDKAVQRNVKKQIRQVWDYIDSELEKGKDVSPGIIFPKRPKNKERMHLIEKLFEERGIPVVWKDESVRKRKKRNENR